LRVFVDKFHRGFEFSRVFAVISSGFSRECGSIFCSVLRKVEETSIKLDQNYKYLHSKSNSVDISPDFLTDFNQNQQKTNQILKQHLSFSEWPRIT
jgi:hypothetical protein